MSAIIWSDKVSDAGHVIRLKRRDFLHCTAAIKRAAKLAWQHNTIVCIVGKPDVADCDRRTILRLARRYGIVEHPSLLPESTSIVMSADYRLTQWSKALNPSYPNFTGHVSAKYLFVGDRINQVFRWPHPPFYARHGCVPWLNTQLDSARIPEAYIAWMNSSGVQGMDDINVLDDIFDIIRHNPDIKVVTMGQASDKILGRVVHHSRIAHPQWAKRFHHNDDYYLRQLSEIKGEVLAF